MALVPSSGLCLVACAKMAAVCVHPDALAAILFLIQDALDLDDDVTLDAKFSRSCLQQGSLRNCQPYHFPSRVAAVMTF